MASPDPNTANPPAGSATSSPDPLSAEAILCPICGYDLRGTSADRCSECGQLIDREALKTSGFPWAHRRQIGRIAAYLKTVWLVSIDSRKLRFEASKPQNLHDARVFRWISTAIIAAATIGAFIAYIAQAGFEVLAVQRSNFGPGGGISPVWLTDILVPWSAGATIRPTPFILLIILAIYLTAVPARLIYIRDASEHRQDTSAAIGFYAVGPMVILGPLLLAAVGIFLSAKALHIRVLAGLATAVAMIVPIVRIAQWNARVRHAGLGHRLFAAGQLITAWLFGPILILALLPWCVGFLWIVIDSFR